MSRHALGQQGEELIYETARILCEEALWDYRTAKLKAALRLGLSPRAALPENARIQTAVIDYQRLYGGTVYHQRLQQCRDTAVQALMLLAGFEPRLTGAAVSGAITQGHRVQLHGFADMPETLDFFLQDQGIPYEQGERLYRYADGSKQTVPLSRFEAGKIGVDVAMFDPDLLHRPPLSPSDGLPMRRLDLQQARRLAGLPTDGPANNG